MQGDHRVEPPTNGDEYATLTGFLSYLRQTVRWKTDGLDADALCATLAPSTMTLGGMLKHLAFVDDYWVNYRFTGNRPRNPFGEVDWGADADWDWHSAANDSPEELRQLFNDTIASSDALIAGRSLDELAVAPPEGMEPLSLRWILTHLIEEYARHCGHADLIRESIDGQTGE